MATHASSYCPPTLCITLGRAPRVGLVLQTLADKKARLSLNLGVLLSLTSFYASYTQFVWLDKTARDQDRLLLDELGYTLAALGPVLPGSAAELLVPPREVGAEEPPRKLQRDLTKAANSKAHQDLVDAIPDAPNNGTHARDRRVLKHPTDAFLPFLALPTSADLSISPRDFISGLRFFLLLPQLLRLPAEPVVVDRTPDSTPDYSYDADLCPRCNVACDRHLTHAHSCPSSSHKITDRHELVKFARTDIVKLAGFTEVVVEPRLDPLVSQRRADIFYTDNTAHVRIDYWTDDTGGHPLCKSNIVAEVADPFATLHKLEREKEKHYADALFAARSVPAVLSGLKVVRFFVCSFTSLGGYGKGMLNCLKGSAGFYKKALSRAEELMPRDDGLTPQFLAGRFRFRSRVKLQVAILTGNARLAHHVGL